MTHLDFLELIKDIRDRRILYGMLDDHEQKELNEMFTRYNKAVFAIDDVIRAYDVEVDSTAIVNGIIEVMEQYQIPFQRILDFESIMAGDDNVPVTMLS